MPQVPLRHELVHRLRREMEDRCPSLERMEINGGVRDLAAIRRHLGPEGGMDGVMLGRLARDDPFFFAQVVATGGELIKC